ncbi:non-ribosomal peptide synthetase [Streptomyces sp. HMX112]|uniref:non-ribosomal peptide synthetase n=1 Tax=Streptomyces sp. HMX112 TaxID=3390850 RepID=UPI003A801532
MTTYDMTDRPGAPAGLRGPVTAADVHPMSFEQESIWLNDQFQAGSGRYVESWVHRLRGAVDVSAVEAALTAVVARHEPLRTTLVLDRGRTVQRVHPAGPVPLSIRQVGPGGVAEAVRDAVSGPLPVDRPPLLRATLLRIGERDAVLALALHHAAIDGWSLRLLDGEFSELYRAAAAGRPPRLPAPPVPFGAYARAQRATGGGRDTDLEYWRRTMDGAPAESTFPLDRPRPAVSDHRGGLVEFAIGPDLGQAVRATCRELRTTPFVLLTAVMTALVARLGGQDDLVLGTPVSRRDRLELEPLIACLTDVMPLRQRVRPGQTFRELVRATTATVRGAMAHRDVPHSLLVRELAGERSPARFPLFQVVFTVDDADAPGLSLPGVTAERLYGHNGTAKFDVFLELVPRDGGYLGLLEYATGLFDASTARRLTERFTTLLADATADPGKAVDELAVMAGDELRLVTGTAVRGAGPGRAAASGGPGSPGAGSGGAAREPAHERVLRAARLWPDAVAVVDGDRRMTYAELSAAADGLARRLVRHGLARARVGVRMERSADALVAVLAVLRAGGACVPLDPSLPTGRTALLVRDSAVAAVLTRRAASGTPEGVPVLFVDCPDDTAPGPETGLPSVGPEDLAYVVHTSGSTGRPKGVAMPHRSLAALLDWQCAASDADTGWRTLQFAPLGFDVAFQEMFATWARGGTLVVADDGLRRDPDRLLDLVERHSVGRVLLPYVALQQLAEYAVATGRGAASLREVITAGEQLYVTPAIREFFTSRCPGARLENQYGPSETHVVTTHRLTGPPAEWPERPPVGRPVPGSRVYVLDDRLRPRPIGAVGEICVGGDSVALGYLSDGEEEARRFVPAPQGLGPGRLYRTGDLGRFLPDGTIEFLGRGDDQVKIRGYRVEPGEVEAALKAVPGVTDAVVLVDGARAEERRLVGCYTTAGSGEPAPERVREALRERLPHYLVPAVLTPIPGLPLTASGKTDRAAVHRRHVAARPAPRSTQPRPARPPGAGSGPARDSGPVHGALAALWADVLRPGHTGHTGPMGPAHPADPAGPVSSGPVGPLDAVDPDETFFSLGGDSLLAVRLSIRIRAELGLDVRPADVFEAPTLRALTALAGRRAGVPADTTAPDHGPGSRAVLDPAVRPAADITRTATGPRHLLLTGATGFLGAFLLHELLARTGATVHCLVRADDAARAGKRLRSALEEYGLWRDEHSDRIRAVTGDLARPALGLDQREFDRLARTADAVFHVGAAVNLTYGYDRLRAANVEGTAEVLRLAAAHRTVPVHHVSTVGVFPSSGAPGPTPPRILPGDPLGDGSLLRGGYARTKWTAEVLVAQARERGLPVTVYRPTRISGSAATGVCQTSDFLWLLVKGCLQAGAAPADYVADFDLVPVDWVAAAIGALAADPAAAGGTFHLSSERRLLFTEVVARLRALGYRLADVPLEEWHRRVERRPDSAAFPLLGLLPATGRETALSPLFDSGTTRHALRGSGAACPEIDDALFARYVRSFVREGFWPPAP